MTDARTDTEISRDVALLDERIKTLDVRLKEAELKGKQAGPLALLTDRATLIACLTLIQSIVFVFVTWTNYQKEAQDRQASIDVMERTAEREAILTQVFNQPPDIVRGRLPAISDLLPYYKELLCEKGFMIVPIKAQNYQNVSPEACKTAFQQKALTLYDPH